VIIVRGSALPESDCTLTNSLIDDKDDQSIVFDGNPCVCVCVCMNPVTVTGCTSVDIGNNANLELVDNFCYLGDMLSVG